MPSLCPQGGGCLTLNTLSTQCVSVVRVKTGCTDAKLSVIDCGSHVHGPDCSSFLQKQGLCFIMLHKKQIKFSLAMAS